jgi:hypothetical protein
MPVHIFLSQGVWMIRFFLRKLNVKGQRREDAERYSFSFAPLRLCAFALNLFLLFINTLECAIPREALRGEPKALYQCVQPDDIQIHELNEWDEFPVWGIVRGSYTFGEGIGVHHRYGTVSALFIPCLDSIYFQPFLDFRGHYSSDCFAASNWGAGVRFFDNINDMTWGFNIYYDRRGTCLGHFNQVGAGLEFLGRCNELRVNTYFPTNSRHTKKFFSSKDSFDHFFVTEYAQRGFDLEFGRNLTGIPQCHITLWGGIGTYYFKDVKGHKHRWGQKVRAALYWGSLLNFQANVMHDNLQNMFFQGVVELSIPFDLKRFLDECIRLSYPKVIRNDMVVLRKRCRCCINK